MDVRHTRVRVGCMPLRAPQAGQQTESSLPPSLVVFGGRGFVGSHILKEAISQGLHVVSVSRSGEHGPGTPGPADPAVATAERQRDECVLARCLPVAGTPPARTEPWQQQVEWVRGNALEPLTYQHLLPSALGVVSAVGAFGSQEEMLKVRTRAVGAWSGWG